MAAPTETTERTDPDTGQVMEPPKGELTTRPEDISLPEDVVLRVENVSKKFCRNLRRNMFYGIVDLAQNMIGIRPDSTSLRQDEFWALKDITFDLKRGDTLGLIGINGAGKTTLLRLLSGIFPPDTGRIISRGRIASLISVGAGFHPHMTGHENIYLNGSLLGMSRKQIEDRYDSIVNFADIGDFLESPVAAYSSGMRVRLGFAIAVHCDPEILLVDEVLSVGDLHFRNKSLRKMHEFRQKASALIFVSHQLEQVRNLCSRVIILDKGGVVFNGPTHQACVYYEEENRELLQRTYDYDPERFRFREGDHEELEFVRGGVADAEGEEAEEIEMDEPLRMFCDFQVKRPMESLYFSVTVVEPTDEANCIWAMSNDDDRFEAYDLQPGRYRVWMTVPEHHLKPGNYTYNFSIRNGVTGETFDRVRLNDTFVVRSDGRHLDRGVIAVEEEWRIENVH